MQTGSGKADVAQQNAGGVLGLSLIFLQVPHLKKPNNAVNLYEKQKYIGLI